MICDRLRAGCTRKAAYGSVGISDETFRRWLHGKVEFVDAVTRAEAEAELRMSSLLAKAAIDDWRAAESWLKRRRPDEWGDRALIEVEARRMVRELMEMPSGDVLDTLGYSEERQALPAGPDRESSETPRDRAGRESKA